MRLADFMHYEIAAGVIQEEGRRAFAEICPL